MLEQHKEQLKALDAQLQNEQERQLSQLKEKLKNRNEASAKQKVLRDIRMAEIQKKKEDDIKKANREISEFVSMAKEGDEKQVNLELQKCLDKVAEYQRKLALKQCYSKQPMYFKRHLINQQKLNNFLDRSAFEDWSVSRRSRQNSMLEKLSEATMTSEQLETADIGTITFKTLLDRL